MGLQLEDGTGKGYQAKITNENQLKTVAEIHELQHHISATAGQVYQVVGELIGVNTGASTVLHLKNSSTTRIGVVSYMRFQTPTPSGNGDWLPDGGTYFQIGSGTTYSTGGTSVTPFNMNLTSGNVADLVAYKDSPTVTGTFTEFDRWYPDGGGMQTYNKHGSLILGLDDTIEVRFTTDRPALQVAWCRITIMLISSDDFGG
jgi:hypothetical protein